VALRTIEGATITLRTLWLNAHKVHWRRAIGTMMMSFRGLESGNELDLFLGEKFEQ
jgi:hypothetical protein